MRISLKIKVPKTKKINPTSCIQTNFSFPFPGLIKKNIHTNIVLDASIVHLWAALAYFVTATPVELNILFLKIEIIIIF